LPVRAERRDLRPVGAASGGTMTLSHADERPYAVTGKPRPARRGNSPRLYRHKQKGHPHDRRLSRAVAQCLRAEELVQRRNRVAKHFDRRRCSRAGFACRLPRAAANPYMVGEHGGGFPGPTAVQHRALRAYFDGLYRHSDSLFRWTLQTQEPNALTRRRQACQESPRVRR